MLFMGAIAFQPAAESAFAAYKEQKALQAILDANLQHERPSAETYTALSGPFQLNSQTEHLETGDAAIPYNFDMLDEAEAFTAERFIIKFKETASVDAVMAAEQAIRKVDTVESVSALEISRGGASAGSAAALSVISTGSAITVEELESKLGSALLMEIEYLQPDYEMTFSSLGGQAASDGLDAAGSTTSPDPSGVNGIVVALLDTGVDTNHPRLAGKLTAGYDFVNDAPNVNSEEWHYDQGHGTSMAGAIASSGTMVMPLKVFEGGKAYTSDIVRALAYAEENGAAIANLSFGSRYLNPALEEAVAGSGMLIVCAAGNMLANNDKYPVFPASFDYPNVLAVASVDDGDKLARFSNYGIGSVEIAARGVNIPLPFLDKATVETSGTSVSAAFVSAAAAQTLAAYGSLDAAGLKKRLVDSADSVTGLMDKVANGKRLNLAYAVSAQAGPNMAVIDVPDPEPLPDVVLDKPIEEDYEEFGADGLITYRAPMPTAREGLGVVAISKKIYAIGGQFNSTYYNKVEIYDTQTDTWTTGANMTYGVSYFSCVAVGTDIYCIGGYNGSYRNYVQVYNTLNNSWSTKTPGGASFPNLMGTAAVANNGSIFVSGGYNGSFRNFVYQYSIAENKWTQLGALKNARAYHNAFIYNGAMYVEGGANSTSGFYVQVEEMYNLSNYTATANGASRVYGMNAAVILKDDRLVIVGGSGYLNGSYSNIILQRGMQDINNGYRRINVMTAPRASLGAALVDGIVYMIGGKNSQYIYNTVEAMEAGFTYLSLMPEKLSGFKAVELAGNIYIAGGYTVPGNTASRAMYAYNILSNTWTQKANLPSGTTSNLISSVYGKLYLFDRNSSNATRVFAYDPQTNAWSDIESSPKTFSNIQALNGKIYCFTNSSAVVDVFDVLTRTWSQAAARPGNAYIYSTTVLSGKLYVNTSDGYICCYDPGNNTWTSDYSGSYSSYSAPVYRDIYLFYAGVSGEINHVYRYSPEENMLTYYVSYLHEYNYFHQICTANNKVYLFAGHDLASGAEAIVEYMPSVSPWAHKQFPQFFNAHMASAAIGSKIYLAGGDGYTGVNTTYKYMKETYEYDAQTDSWTQKADMPTARSKVAGAEVNGKFYAIGGETAASGASTNKVEEFTPNSGSGAWSTKAVLPYTAHSVAAASYNGKIYTFGGRNGTSGAYNYVREYDPSTNAWSTAKAAMPTARYGASAVELNGMIYVAGGFNSAGTALKTLEVYDPANNKWSAKAAMPEAKGYCGGVADNGVYLIGGSDTYNSVNTVYQYNPAVDKWYHWPGLDDAIEGVAAAAINNGIYVINGINNNRNPNGSYAGTIPSANYYTPTSSLSDYAELTHLGSDVVNLTGNFSRTYTDLSYAAQGFNIEFTRTYNSGDARASLISPGWTFGFQGKVDSSGNDTIVRLPNGSGLAFKGNPNGTFTALNSRSSLVKNPDNTYTLTTKDQYSYGFNTNGYMCWMKDRDGNTITITVNATGQVTAVTDQVGRVTTIAYASNRISTITDPVGRVVTYAYDANGRLSSVKDPNGSFTYYAYFTSSDENGLLNTIKDHNNVTVESATYYPKAWDKLPRVKTETSRLGNVTAYVYADNDGKMTATDSNGRATVTWYDKAVFPIRVLDAEGRETLTGYHLADGLNRYGEVNSRTDRNGNSTFFERDAQGNITMQVNPDGSTREFTYDNKNNLLSEKDELGKMTFYVYDASGVNLVKIARPLNGTDVYSAGVNQASFAISSYVYYTSSEALSQTGKTIYGLLKTETGPEGGVTTYSYDANGYASAVTSPMQRSTTYQNNKIGWLKSSTTPRGHTTSHYYDRNGNLLKTVSPDGGVQRFAYNSRNQMTQRVMPTQYLASADTAATFSAENIQSSASAAYSQAGHGYRYAYAASGALTSVSDPLNYLTAYTYDLYGNTLTETKPNGAVYGFTYNKIDLLLSATFKEASSSPAVTLSSYSYAILSSGNTTVTATQYFDNANIAATKTTFDYAGRPIRVDQADGTTVYSAYNANGTLKSSTDANGGTAYYEYDGLNRQVRQWAPVSASAYEYSAITYDKAGRVLTSIKSKNTVANGTIPTTGLVTVSFVYNADGQVSQETTSGGAKTEFSYDNNGNLTEKLMYYSPANYNREFFTYDSMDRLLTSNIATQNRDIYGYPDTTAELALTTTFSYDKNGNILTVADPNSIVTTYTYDLLDRRLTTSQPGVDENNAAVAITTSATYDWAGNILASTNELGDATAFAYDQRGNLSTVKNALNGIRYFAYDRAGRKTAEVSPRHYNSVLALTNMPRTEYAYDEMGRLLREAHMYKDDVGAWKTVVSSANTYDNNGNIIKSQDALGYQQGYGAQFEYDRQNRVIKVTDPLGNISTVAYDGLGRVATETNARGVATAYTYDDNGNILSVTTAGILLQRNTYDLLGNLLTQTDGNGNTAAFAYNSLNLPRSTVLPGDGTIGAYSIAFRYTKLGQAASEADSLSKQKTVTYDNKGRMKTATTYAAASNQTVTVSWRYDKAGNLRYYVDGNGDTTQHTYDQLGRTASTSWVVVDINNVGRTNAMNYVYDANGNLLSEQSSLANNTYSYSYDALDRLTQKLDPYGAVIEKLEYDDNNQQVKSTDALGNTVKFEYDCNGRLKKTIDGVGNQQEKHYDAAGNTIQTTDGNGYSAYFTYDGLSRLTQVKNALNEITAYTYDPNGNMLTQTDGKGNTTTMMYNARNLVTHRVEPGGMSGQNIDMAKTMRYFYYADGSVMNMVDQNGAVTLNTYDLNGKIRSQYVGGKITYYRYDNNGNLLTQTDESGVTTRTYDSLGRVTSKDVPGIGLTTYLYDITSGISAGHLGLKITDPKGNITEEEYDRAGRLYRVRSGADTTEYTYFANGNRKSMAYPNGVVAEYTYYADNRLHTLANKKGNTFLSTFNYAYDGNGNMAAKLELKGMTTYAYDALGRLKQVVEPDGRQTAYTFDAAGNRLAEAVTVDNSVTTTWYAYNEQNRLLSTVEVSGGAEKTTAFQYDNNGNEISRLVSTISDGSPSPGFALSRAGAGSGDEITFEISGYDAYGRLVSVYNDNYAASYTYNHDGLRASKSVTEDGAASTTKFLYNSGYIALELDGAGAQTAFNVFGGSSVISRTTTQSTDYYLYNGRGDVVQLTNSAGSVTATYDYDAFGNLLSVTNHLNPFRYCGEYWDYETKRYYMRARYYSPATGRFTQEDTIRGFANDPMSLNLFTYCNNNPIKYIDPTGHILTETDKANLTYQQQQDILIATAKYNSAPAGPDGDEQRAKANAEANAIRASAGYTGGRNGATISINSGKSVDTVVVDKITTVNNRGSITTVNVLSGATSSIYNSGTIGTINNSGTINGIYNYNTGSIGTINNNGTIKSIGNSGTINYIFDASSCTISTISNYSTGSVGTIGNGGTIGTIINNGIVNYIGSYSNGSVNTISNSASINNINTGKNTSCINNYGEVGSIAAGANCVIKVNNNGFIGSIYLGGGGILDGSNYGFVEKISGFSRYKFTDQWHSSTEESLLLMQNRYILNYLLTEEEQTKGVGVSRIGGKLYRDISIPVANALATDLWMFEERRGGDPARNNLWFAEMVSGDGMWNLKYRRGNITNWEYTLGIPFWGYNTRMVLNGSIVTVEDVGNTTYGYLGIAIGFSQSWLITNSELNHLTRHGLTEWGNERHDQTHINIGINWFLNNNDFENDDNKSSKNTNTSRKTWEVRY